MGQGCGDLGLGFKIFYLVTLLEPYICQLFSQLVFWGLEKLKLLSELLLFALSVKGGCTGDLSLLRFQAGTGLVLPILISLDFLGSPLLPYCQSCLLEGFSFSIFIIIIMKPNFLQLIHQNAAEKRRVQSLRQESSNSDQRSRSYANTMFQKLQSEEYQQPQEPSDPTINQIQSISRPATIRTPELQEKHEEISLEQSIDRLAPQEIFDAPLQIVFENPSPIKSNVDKGKYSNKKYLNDIDRKLAVFYHPLFMEICDEWIRLLIGNEKDVKQEKINFITFVEMNLRLQKCLLAKFDLSSAFVSALKDWVKEVGDCLQLKSLYYENQSDLAKEYIKSLHFQPALSEIEYQKFFDQQRNTEIYKYLTVSVTVEICSKFLFDLCLSWCQHLDVELFSYFLLGLWLQISDGESIETASLKPLQNAQLLPAIFLDDFQQQVQLYTRYKRKNLQYYRAWCEWNYLRMEEIGESVLAKLFDMFPEEYTI